MENNSRNPIKFVDGVRVYKKAGQWYADYQIYEKLAITQGRRVNIDKFCNWCD